MSPIRRASLDHLLAMTDDVGLLQHAVLDVPNRACGYCTDDAGRALIVACDAAARRATKADGARLVSTYLAYLHDAQLPDGWFHDFMGYDRRWQDDRGTEDAVGRAIWGLGYAERNAPRETWRTVARTMRRRAHDAIARLSYPRSRAYAALGLSHVLASDALALDFGAQAADAPGPASRPHDTSADGLPAGTNDESEARALLDRMLAPIADAFDACATGDWRWCEDVLTYDNARLCEALLRGGAVLGADRYVRTGLEMLDFYSSVVIENHATLGRIFVPVGSRGWYPRGGEKSRSGQQPLEAAAMVDAAFGAADVTGDARWSEIAEIAHAWYLGRNTHGIAVATESGCCDGLDDLPANAVHTVLNGPSASAPHVGLNPNMGAESTVCYLMSANALANRSTPSLRVAR
ncbi:MAG TPA: hypothetical protein VGD01_16330 [Candidatus Elarobacter sp.]|jgi:hypothetical protein